MRYLIFGLIVLITLAHQDTWWAADSKTLVLGFLPVSLAYHIGISIAASVLWGLACVYCWPSSFDVPDEDAWVPPTPGKGGH